MEKYKKIVNRYRAFLYLFILTMTFSAVHAQVNYVLNPSFEQYSRCPNSLDEIKFANYWTTIDSSVYPPADSFGNGVCTPEYCNECATDYSVSVPNNGKFYHYPRTGKGMAQVLMFHDESVHDRNERDYLQGHLRTNLTPGKSYCVTFFVTLDQEVKYAVNNIGAYLDNGIIDTTQNCGLPQTTHIPQVVEVNIINDTLNWVKVEGTFIANGAEQYITIGNFYDKAHTSYIVANPFAPAYWYSAYLIDDVSVVECDIPAYAGGKFFKAKNDSVFIGRNEIVPDCMWYRNGVLIDTIHAGFWVKDTVNTMYVVKQSICGNVKYDTAWVNIANAGVSSVGSESVYRIYPNPANKEIMIQAPNNTSTVTMAIYDMSGRVMLQKEIGFAGGECRVPLSLTSGMYFVEIIDKDGGKNIQRLSIL